MRYFKLINSKGDELDITTQEVFFHEIDGLGFEEETSYRRVGELWWLNNVSYRQTPITGKVSFTEYGDTDPYTKFNSFVVFITKAPLTMLYYPHGITGRVYRRQVRVTKLDKSEINTYGIIEEDIVFTPYTPWYEVITVTNGKSDSSFTGAWIWGSDTTPPLVFEPTTEQTAIPARFGAENNRWVRITVPSSVKSPAKLTIFGPVVDPVWTHYVDGELVSSGGFSTSLTVTDDEAIVIDNTTGIPSIKKYYVYSGEITEEKLDIYQLRNFNLGCFITLLPGNNRIAIGSSGEAEVRIILEGHIYNASV